MNHSSAKRYKEKAVFKTFIQLHPNFAGEPIAKWILAEQDPPDILCTTLSGKILGVELTEWIHQKEMDARKLREIIHKQIMEAIGTPQPVNVSQNFDMVIFYPKDKVRNIQRNPFREELWHLIKDVDRRWPTESSWQFAAGCRINRLNGYPELSRHINSVHFPPGSSKREKGIDWIFPPAIVDSFDYETMTRPLYDALCKKVTKYKNRAMKTDCQEYVLLVYFDQGLMYNSPISRSARSIQTFVDDVRLSLPRDHGLFSKAYLFFAPSPGEIVIELWS